MYECVSIFNRYNKIYKAKLNRKEELALHFIELLSVNFEKERSVTYYGHQLHITPKYLTETMKEITGKTAGELIDQAVIMQAKVLLSNPSLNINQVAEALNFSDQSFFGKFFKKHVGVSPLKYRSTSRYKPTFKPK
jgi:YesN/AraC family two-component response regulator